MRRGLARCRNDNSVKVNLQMKRKSGRSARVSGGVALLLVMAGAAACAPSGHDSKAAANDAPPAAVEATSTPSAAPTSAATKTMFGLRAVHMTASSWAYKPL